MLNRTLTLLPWTCFQLNIQIFLWEYLLWGLIYRTPKRKMLIQLDPFLLFYYYLPASEFNRTKRNRLMSSSCHLFFSCSQYISSKRVDVNRALTPPVNLVWSEDVFFFKFLKLYTASLNWRGAIRTDNPDTENKAQNFALQLQTHYQMYANRRVLPLFKTVWPRAIISWCITIIISDDWRRMAPPHLFQRSFHLIVYKSPYGQDGLVIFLSWEWRLRFRA